MSKFKLLKDLGTIIVPKTYRHSTALATFTKQYAEKLLYMNPAITDENFPNPSRILKVGEVLYVSAWEHADGVGATSSIERMGFLRSKNALLVGAQGGALTFVQKRKSLPKGYWYCSMDESKKLWEDADGHHRVPGVDASHGGDFEFVLGGFGDGWHDDVALLCFRDQPLET